MAILWTYLSFVPCTRYLIKDDLFICCQNFNLTKFPGRLPTCICGAAVTTLAKYGLPRTTSIGHAVCIPRFGLDSLFPAYLASLLAGTTLKCFRFRRCTMLTFVRRCTIGGSSFRPLAFVTYQPRPFLLILAGGICLAWIILTK